MTMTNALDWYRSIQTPRVEEIKLDFAVALEQAAEQEGISKVELARRTGVSAARITKALRGDSNLTIETMEKLAQAANRTIHIHLAALHCDVYHFELVDASDGQIETVNEIQALPSLELSSNHFFQFFNSKLRHNEEA